VYLVTYRVEGMKKGRPFVRYQEDMTSNVMWLHNRLKKEENQYFIVNVLEINDGEAHKYLGNPITGK